MCESVKIVTVLAFLQSKLANATPPMTERLLQEIGGVRDPFVVLVSCLISLRARDKTTYFVCKSLFAQIRTPHDLLTLSTNDLEQIIVPAGMYRQKAKILQSVCQELLTRFDGMVPFNRSDLLSIKHIGHKTAALVLSLGYNIPAICVDVHVHRLTNAIGFVRTKNPAQSEKELEAVVPKAYWKDINRLFVMLGQLPARAKIPLIQEANNIFTCDALA